jgi:hypothetical protein
LLLVAVALGTASCAGSSFAAAFVGLRADDWATALRGLADFAATRLAAAFFATFADFLDVLPASFMGSLPFAPVSGPAT